MVRSGEGVVGSEESVDCEGIRNKYITKYRGRDRRRWRRRLGRCSWWGEGKSAWRAGEWKRDEGNPSCGSNK